MPSVPSGEIMAATAIRSGGFSSNFSAATAHAGPRSMSPQTRPTTITFLQPDLRVTPPPWAAQGPKQASRCRLDCRMPTIDPQSLSHSTDNLILAYKHSPGGRLDRPKGAG